MCDDLTGLRAGDHIYYRDTFEESHIEKVVDVSGGQIRTENFIYDAKTGNRINRSGTSKIKARKLTEAPVNKYKRNILYKKLSLLNSRVYFLDEIETAELNMINYWIDKVIHLLDLDVDCRNILERDVFYKYDESIRKDG